MTKHPECNVAWDHAEPDECAIIRCATCGEPYDGTEPAPEHIARAHRGTEITHTKDSGTGDGFNPSIPHTHTLDPGGAG